LGSYIKIGIRSVIQEQNQSLKKKTLYLLKGVALKPKKKGEALSNCIPSYWKLLEFSRKLRSY
jgi:hypothetical protein